MGWEMGMIHLGCRGMMSSKAEGVGHRVLRNGTDGWWSEAMRDVWKSQFILQQPKHPSTAEWIKKLWYVLLPWIIPQAETETDNCCLQQHGWTSQVSSEDSRHKEYVLYDSIYMKFRNREKAIKCRSHNRGDPEGADGLGGA